LRQYDEFLRAATSTSPAVCIAETPLKMPDVLSIRVALSAERWTILVENPSRAVLQPARIYTSEPSRNSQTIELTYDNVRTSL
jgi:hypothetical protein